MLDIKVPDILFILGYVLLILVYSQHLQTRQSIASIAGYTVLLLAKRLEYSRGKHDKITKEVKKIGYAILFLSPSFTHWYDALAIIGYMFCIFGMFDDSAPPLAVYYILGANQTTATLSMIGRSLLGLALMMGYKSPFQ